MLRLKCIGGPLYGQEYSHPYHEFTFLDQHTGKKIVYRKHTLDFKPPQDFFVAESISRNFAYQLALQVLHSQYLSKN
ncbi:MULTISPECIES: hypothetical protein [Acinetobacter]|uniref:hypothetical protein n=1 Tax=Acinetobacter TaxID=469 RepID=UPI00141B1215|nr:MULTISPECIES: hypothetical protein [Acinetobacter]MCS4297135.1 hypothetical protein [Acinetobacter guillouiae]MCW2250184.1 hypothetical protein [Acinetobacter sp. BIGb0204]NII39287.1 hypothetical protein [Acinetobacter sp. BIGb0196]